jgi:hypothetical protein
MRLGSAVENQKNAFPTVVFLRAKGRPQSQVQSRTIPETKTFLYAGEPKKRFFSELETLEIASFSYRARKIH